MRVEIDIDETWALLSVMVNRVTADPALPDEDRAAIRRWRSDKMKPSSEAVKALAAKINEDLARAIKKEERSQIRKSDWR